MGGCGPGQQKLQWTGRAQGLQAEPKGLAGCAAGRMCLEPLSRLLALTDRGQSLLQLGGEVVPQHGMSKDGMSKLANCAVCRLRGCLLWVCLRAESP